MADQRNRPGDDDKIESAILKLWSVVDDLAAQLSEKGYMPRIEEAR